MLLKDSFLKNIVEVYPQVAEMQLQNGCFRDPANGYTIYKQYAGYYFAYLYTCENSLNPYYGDADTYARAIRGWDFYYTQITEEGLAKIITFDQIWYDSIDEWGLYFWLNTIDLIGSQMDTDTLERWNSCIDRAMARVKEHIEKQAASVEYNSKLAQGNVQNHYVWTLLLYYRYGMLRNLPDALETARLELEKVISFQSVEGTWKEAGTMVVKYSEVTFAAISLFEMYSNNEKARESVRKSLSYVLNTIYPDFTKNDCLDGRNRYSRSIVGYTALTFTRYKEGVCYLTRWIRHMREYGNIGKELQGLAVITDLTRYMDSEVECLEEDIENYIPDNTYYEGLDVSIRRRSGWTVTMCCLKQEALGNRWILERQNLLSIFNKNTGLLIGGGHSISQPELSCFNVISKGNVYYLHDSGRVDPDTDTMSLVYGGISCSIRLEEVSSDWLKLEYCSSGLKETDRIYVNIPFMVKLGDIISIAGKDIVLSEYMQSAFIDKNQPFAYKGSVIEIDADASFLYPVLPYNSYKQEQKRVFSEVFGIIRVELDYRHSSCVLKLKLS